MDRAGSLKARFGPNIFLPNQLLPNQKLGPEIHHVRSEKCTFGKLKRNSNDLSKALN